MHADIDDVSEPRTHLATAFGADTYFRFIPEGRGFDSIHSGPPRAKVGE